ncbi:MAG: hypothetical protein ACI9EF_000124 [Pseudohongiellaceae bacterium]|jgi:hypothetical protein
MPQVKPHAAGWWRARELDVPSRQGVLPELNRDSRSGGLALAHGKTLIGQPGDARRVHRRGSVRFSEELLAASGHVEELFNHGDEGRSPSRRTHHRIWAFLGTAQGGYSDEKDCGPPCHLAAQTMLADSVPAIPSLGCRFAFAFLRL